MIVEFQISTRDHGEVAGATTPVSVVETERRFDLGVVDLFMGTSPRMEALYWLLWRSLNPDADISDDAPFMSWLCDLVGFTVKDADLPPPPPQG